MRKAWILALVGLAVAGAIVVAVIADGGDEDTSGSGTVDPIKVEMRAYPVAEIRVDGKKIGKTPLSLTYPRSTKQITVEATMVRHLIRRGNARDDVYRDVRTITLDRDHLLDFKLDTAKMMELGEEPNPATTEGSARP
jgi:hypothetical protein